MESSDGASLEEKLRQMLLSNVRIEHETAQASNISTKQAATQAQYGPPANHHNRGRYQNGRSDVSNGASHGRQQFFLPRGVRTGPHPQQEQGLQHAPRGPRGVGALYSPQPSHSKFAEQNAARARYLDDEANTEIARVQMSAAELEAKNQFRAQLNAAFVSVQDDEGAILALQSFGSLKSGFATAGSDMDLVIVDIQEDARAHPVSLDPDGLPRRFEKLLLDQGIGARLLTKARVPIIKVCEKPPDSLLEALREAREAAFKAERDEEQKDATGQPVPDGQNNGLNINDRNRAASVSERSSEAGAQGSVPSAAAVPEDAPTVESALAQAAAAAREHKTSPNESDALSSADTGPPNAQIQHPSLGAAKVEADKIKKRPQRSNWTREKKAGPLDFPKEGVGIQCDINFFNPLGLYNTHMLHCYSLCDPRVREMILFVKAWARRRKINSPYSGTLSSYGYVLMVLHYLVNVARPAVLPNLQMEAHRLNLPGKVIDDWEVNFLGNEAYIRDLVARNVASGMNNRASLGMLLSGFFQYYATSNGQYGFTWMRDVISLRTPGGVISKEQKGWTGAKTETTDVKEVRHRYLFAIEDPFELTHNVARTVTSPGIIAIRDEFRRVWRIIQSVGYGNMKEHILDELKEDVPEEAVVQQGSAPAVTT